jgi:hypothetical protein
MHHIEVFRHGQGQAVPTYDNIATSSKTITSGLDWITDANGPGYFVFLTITATRL